MKSITDKAEVSIDFPDKAYMGSFGRDAEFQAGVDDTGVLLKLTRTGDDRRTVEVHLHYYLFADILADLAAAIAKHPIDKAHRRPLLEASKALQRALAKESGKSRSS